MSLCASCGYWLDGDAALCPHHHSVYGNDWSAANRIMCDFFHRRKVPPRLPQFEREGDFWRHAGEADPPHSEPEVRRERQRRHRG